MDRCWPYCFWPVVCPLLSWVFKARPRGKVRLAARCARPGAGQGRGAPQALQTIKVRDNLFMIGNAGGNTAVFIMTNGVTLVDTKNPNTGQAILDQVRMVTPKPITMVINTHTHADHTGSNEFFTDNVVFVAQENTKANMEKMTNFAADKAKFLPSRTYKDTLTIGSGADQIVLYYFGRAHTNGDSFVVFPAIRAMHTGDAFATKGFPNVDIANGGSVVDYGKTLARRHRPSRTSIRSSMGIFRQVRRSSPTFRSTPISIRTSSPTCRIQSSRTRQPIRPLRNTSCRRSTLRLATLFLLRGAEEALPTTSAALIRNSASRELGRG